MAKEVTTEVVNETDGEVLLKHRKESELFTILLKLPERGARFPIKTALNASFKEYKLVETTSGSSFPIIENDCLENERLVIKKDRAGELRMDKIKRGMSVTEVINDTKHDFHVIENRKEVGVLKAGGDYLIQRDPKGNSEYRLVRGEKPAILIPTGDLVNNQSLTVSGDNAAVISSRIARGLCCTELSLLERIWLLCSKLSVFPR